MRVKPFIVFAAMQAALFGFTATCMARHEERKFPEDKMFRPFLAYYKEPRFFTTLEHYSVRDPYKDSFIVGSVGYGEVFGLYEKRESEGGDGIQIGFGGGVFAQFNLEAPSDDLVNADYTVGIPLMIKRGDTSMRFALYHQSSHLGDEYILSQPDPERVNLSYEALQFFLARNIGRWRPYGGYEYLVHKNPKDLDRNIFHAGLEYYGGGPVFQSGRFVAGVHLMSLEEHRWSLSSNAKAGIQFMRKGSNRAVMILLEGYRGHSPHGQFYNLKVQYFGLGVYFLL